MKQQSGKPRPRKVGAAPPATEASSDTSAGASGTIKRDLPAHCGQAALVLQGGGALGAFQAGVYEALAEKGYLPTWITGISIGAINGAIIAGNPPERRVDRLREFW